MSLVGRLEARRFRSPAVVVTPPPLDDSGMKNGRRIDDPPAILFSCWVYLFPVGVIASRGPVTSLSAGLVVGSSVVG